MLKVIGTIKRAMEKSSRLEDVLVNTEMFQIKKNKTLKCYATDLKRESILDFCQSDCSSTIDSNPRKIVIINKELLGGCG